MPVEKSFTEFIVLHEKKIMTKDVSLVENGIETVIKRATAIIGTTSEKELSEASEKIAQGINVLKKVLNKNHLYEL